MTNDNGPSGQPSAPDESSTQPVNPQPPSGPRPTPPAPAGRQQHAVAVPIREPGPFKRGFGLGAGAGLGLGVALLALGTVLSLLSAVAFAAIGAATAAASGEAAAPNLKTTWGSPSAKSTLRAIDISGSILTDSTSGALMQASTYGYEIARTLDQIKAEDADGIVLRMNTPGGTVTGSKAISDAVDRYRARTGKKVFAHVQGLSASGGMYAMAGADDIQADQGSLVGSIGVIMGPLERYEGVTAIDNGILQGGVTAERINQYYLTAGRGKDAGQPFRDLTDEERQVFTNFLQNEYTTFVDHVATKREIPAQAIRDDLGAHLFDTKTAQEKGLIDGTMGVDEAYRHFAQLAGLDPADTHVVAAASPSFLTTLMGAEKRVPGQALPVTAQPGVRPVTSAAMCGPGPRVLVYHGDPTSECG